jgi:SPP1 family predicted phage head-tail adaptor
MQAGKLRHKVAIQKLVAGSPDQKASGEPDTTWTTHLASIWASVEPLTGRELFAAQEHHSEVEVRVRVRYREGITAKMRVVFDSRNYDIVAVIDREERHRELELLCKQGVTAG